MTLRCALYARYSSDQQRAASIEDQFRVCRERAEREGWKIAGAYKDSAIAGDSMILRPGIQALLEDARRGVYEVVVAEALDRVSRDQQPGVAEDDHQGMAPAPGQRERTEVHLALMPRRRLEPDQRFNRFARSRRPHVVVHARVAARVARSADLIEKPLRRQLRERLKTGVDDRLVGVQLVGHRRTGRIPSRTGRQIPVQLAGIDPIVDRPTVHSEPPRQLRLRDAPVQIVLQQHPGLPFVHPRTDPALLAKLTERPGTPSATSPK